MKTVVLEKKNSKFGNEMFDTWKWLLKAKSNDETRGSLLCVLVKGKRAFATDGCRLHIANVKDCAIESGLYRVPVNTTKQIVLQEDTEGWQYPDVEKVVPRHASGKVVLGSVPWKVDKGSYVAARVLRAIKPNLTVNLDWLKDCVMEGDWTMYLPKTGEALYFKNCTRSAVIMPCRID